MDVWRNIKKVPQRMSLRGPRNRSRPLWYLHPEATSDLTAIVVGGASRSGTTLFRVMLDSHPQIACGPESMLFLGHLHENMITSQFGFTRGEVRRLERRSATFLDFVGRFLGEYARRQGKSVVAEKTPSNVQNIGWILDRFPNVQFVHVVRDGRAVVNSMRTHPRFRFVDDQPVPTGIENDLDECITKWMSMVERGLAFDGHPRVTLVRYEDVIDDPRPQLGPVLERVGLPWNDAIANYADVQNESRSGRRLGHTQEAGRPLKKEAAARWQEELGGDQIRRIEDRGGALLERFGYARNTAPTGSADDAGATRATV